MPTRNRNLLWEALALAALLALLTLCMTLAACAPWREPPPPAPQAEEARQEQTTVYVHNPNGSRTPVVLTRVGPDQWRGPRGEVYHGVPAEEALRPAYGLR